MISGASTQFNEMLIDAIKLAMILLMLIGGYCTLYLVNALYYLLKKREEIIAKKKYIIVSSILIISIISIIIFYYPKDVLPSDYDIQTVYITYFTEKNEEKNIKIKDKAIIEDLGNILKEYKCKRNLSSGRGDFVDEKTVFIDMFIKKGNYLDLYHLVIKEDYQKAYKAANIDFIHTINNKDNKLQEKIYNFVDKIKDTYNDNDSNKSYSKKIIDRKQRGVRYHLQSIMMK